MNVCYAEIYAVIYCRPSPSFAPLSLLPSCYFLAGTLLRPATWLPENSQHLATSQQENRKFTVAFWWAIAIGCPGGITRRHGSESSTKALYDRCRF